MNVQKADFNNELIHRRLIDIEHEVNLGSPVRMYQVRTFTFPPT